MNRLGDGGSGLARWRKLCARCWVLGAVVPGAVLGGGVLGAGVLAQGRITNAKMETRSAAQGLEPEVRAVAARATAVWIGYRAPMVRGPRHLCCADAGSLNGSCCGACRLERGSGVTLSENETPGLRVALEPPTELLVFARLEAGHVVRVRTFTPDCDIDASGMPLTWMTDVKIADSVAWLTSLVTGAADAADRNDPVAKPAIGAIALHDDGAADRVLESFVTATRPEWVRRETAFWLGTARGDAGVRLLARMIAEDSSEQVREQAVFGLSVSAQPSALTTLISTARADRSARVRGRALFWLATRAGKQAIDTIAAAIDGDPDTGVKKQAVFALSRLPKEEGVARLLEVARTNKNPEVRKQAMFWLGQSNDPRAVTFFEEILTRK
jgi:HEAT repeats